MSSKPSRSSSEPAGWVAWSRCFWAAFHLLLCCTRNVPSWWCRLTEAPERERLRSEKPHSTSAPIATPLEMNDVAIIRDLEL